ncbi:transcription elongation factor GreA [candidate division SR1 bacterium]|nr:transcription elongation factor GreA [candidate division SR1 bacterium]
MENTKKISREGYEKLINELKDLKQVKLPETLKQLAEAKEMGDLSENFDYKSALEDKDFINSRMKEIEELIDNVEIVDDSTEKEKKKSGKIVEFGSKVTIQTEDDKPYKVTIVGSGEVNAIDEEILISLDSPIGQAIRGKSVGEIGKMRLNNTRKDVKILEIK